MLAFPGVKELLKEMGVLKAIVRPRSITIEKNPVDIELLISQWSIEAHFFFGEVYCYLVHGVN